MKKTTLAIILIFSSFCAYCDQTLEPSKKAFVIISSQNPFSVEVPAGSTFRFENIKGRKTDTFGVLKADGDFAQWCGVKAKITPSESGVIGLTLRGDVVYAKDKKPVGCSVQYADIRIDGKPVLNGDFSDGLNGWNFEENGGYAVRICSGAPDGKNCALTSRHAVLYCRIPAIKGKPVEFFALFRAVGIAEKAKDSIVSLKKSANAVLGVAPPKVLDGGLAAAFKNFPLADGKTREINGINFVIADSEKETQNNAVQVGAGLANLRTIKLESPDASARFLYVLLSAANLHPYVSGAVVIGYADGKSASTHLYTERAVGTFDKPVSKENLLPVTDCAPVLYMVKIPADASRAITRIGLNSMNNATVLFAACTLSDKDVLTTIPKKHEPPEWLPADIGDIFVKEGTALWFGLPESGAPAGKFGRVVISKTGKFEFEKRRGAEVKFFGFNGAPFRRAIVRGDFEKTKENLRKHAEQIRAQGYNATTLWVDASFLNAPTEAGRLEKQAALDYYLYELKKNGIYVQYRLANPNMGQPEFTWETRDEAKVRCIMGEEKMLKIWKNFAVSGLTHKNQFTGTTLAEDPMVISVNYFGEMNSGYERLMANVPYLAPLAEREWRKWLTAKYKSVENLNKSWKLKIPLKSFEEVSMAHYRLRENPVHDWYLFIGEKHVQYNAFCRKVIADAGYKGLVFEVDGSKRVTDAVPRMTGSDICALDIYFSHPRGGFGAVGNSVGQESAVKTAAGYWRSAAAVKIFDRPMIIMEHNHCHWNPFVHEGGILFPAYSAYQGFSQLFIHAGAVDYEVGALGAFSAGSSPVMRANEVLAKFLFSRGDVSASKRRVDLVFTKEYVDNSPHSCQAANPEQTKIALMSGFATRMYGYDRPEALTQSSPPKADIEVAATGFAEIFNSDWFSDVKGAKGEPFDIAAFAQKMRAAGILSKDNISDPKNGVFQSDTGEITMCANESLLKVSTPKSEAVTLLAGKSENVGALRVKSSSVDAAVAVCSVDNKPLRKSSRLLLIYSTDDANSGAEYSADGSMLLKAGKLPVLMRAGVLEAEIETGATAKFALYPLHSDGTRREPLPIEVVGGTAKIRIDTSKLKNGPTSFFEIVAQ